MLVDIIVDGETVLTITLKSVEFLLRTLEETSFPITLDKREIRVRFRKVRE